jgi:hypothetical protein
MENIMVTLTILLIIGSAIFKIISEKRKGMKCVGCHLSGNCSSQKGVANKKLTPTIQMRIEIKELA